VIFTRPFEEGFQENAVCRFHTRNSKLQGARLRRREELHTTMIFPSITTLILGAAVVAVLAAVDWYVWGITPVRRAPLWPHRARFGDDEAPAFKEVA
jgi:hypothetical protein